MSPPSGIDALMERLASGELPEPVRLAAARGALPLPPADLLRAQAWMARHDGSADVQAAAGESLRGVPAAELAKLVEGDGLSPELAEFLGDWEGAPTAVLEALTRNHACPDEVVGRFAPRASNEVVDALLRNEVRLGRALSIVEALESNPGLSAGQRTRLGEIRKHLHEQPVDTLVEAPLSLEPAVMAEMQEAMRLAEQEEERRRSESGRAAPEPQLDGEDGEAGSAEVKTTYQKILELSAGEKVKLAFTGTAEERALLIRDGNRVVSTSVLKSPRISEKDVESYVNMRTLREDILRTIGMNRDWLKSYSVVLGLIRNPKTPPGISMPLLSRLSNRDLNIIGGDRNVTEVIRRQAKKNFVARTSGGRRR